MRTTIRSRNKSSDQRALSESISLLFDADWYCATNPDIAESGVDPIQHFLSVGWAEERSPHPLFDTQWYLATNPDVDQAGINPLIHFLKTGWREGRNPHPLFDVCHYLTTWPDIAKEGVNPLVHYLRFGWREGRTPNAEFDPKAYRAQSGIAEDQDPFTHYVRYSFAEGTRPPHTRAEPVPAPEPVTPPEPVPQLTDAATLDDIATIQASGLFDPLWYMQQYADVREAGVDPVEHYALSGWREARNPSSDFSTGFYLEKYPDVASAGINPFVHWLKYGRNEGRSANLVIVDTMEESPSATPAIIFVSHEASQTGAPSVLLSLMRWVKEHTNINFSIIVGRSGPWNARFDELAPTFYVDAYEDKEDEALNRDLRRFCGNHVQCVYLNTIATGKIARQLEYLQAEFVCHVHEMEYAFTVFEDEIAEIALLCSKYIVVSGGSQQALSRRIDDQTADIYALRPFIEHMVTGTVDTHLDAGKRKIFGCGTCGPRKGFDLFCDVADELRQAGVEDVKLYWIGGMESQHFDPLDEIESRNVGDIVEFLGPRDNPRDYFAKGDIFLLPSREDPFPLVCLEAAECGLPVICFDAQAGDMHSFVEKDAGIVVPYLDVAAMARAAANLLSNESLRAELGERARRKVTSRHLVDVVAPKILGLLPETHSNREDGPLEACKRLIDAHEAVSFDIFDTLVTRRLSRPEVVFDVIEYRHTRADAAPIPFFHERMQTAGQVLGMYNGTRDDISVDEIYCHMPFFNDAAFEKEIEITMCIPHPAGQELYRYALERGKKIYISSDMYLDRTTIEVILRDNGISGWDRLLLSSDIGVKKDTGRLYNILKQHAASDGVAQDRILHIGDNWQGDIRQAREAGLSAVRISPVSEQYEKLIPLPDTDARSLSQTGRIWESFCTQTAALWCDEEPSLSTDVLTRLGFEVSGPLAAMMAIHARKIADSVSARKLVFMARDGRIIKKAFDTLYDAEIAAGRYETPYLHLSRATVVSATFENPLSPTDIYFLVDGLHLAQKPVRYFLGKAGLDADDPEVKKIVERHFRTVDAVPNWNDLGTLTKMFREMSELVHTTNLPKRKALAKYLQDNGITDEENVIVVDVGWLLNIQSRVDRFLRENGARTRMTGCYVGSRDRTNKNLLHSSLLFDMGDPAAYADFIAEHVTLFEVLFSAPEASAAAIEMDGSGNPVTRFRRNPVPLPAEFIAAQKLQMGAEAFFDRFRQAREEFFPERVSKDYFFGLFKALAETDSDLLKATLGQMEIRLGGHHEFVSNEALFGKDNLCEYRLRPPNEYFRPRTFTSERTGTNIVIATSAGLDNGSTRYRSLNLAQSLSRQGATCTVIHAATPMSEARRLIEQADSIVFQRCFAEQGNVGEFHAHARQLGKACISEIDDLVLPAFVETIGSVAGGQWDIDQAMAVATSYESMLRQTDACIVSTPLIKENIERLYGLPSVVVRNKVAPEFLRPPKARGDGRIRLAYASGTYSHREDFALVEDILYNFLKRHTHIRLDVLGAAQISERLLALENVVNYPLLPYEGMLEFISRRDLMLVPLVDNVFNRAKSSVKFVECGAVGVPVLASAVSEFSHAIRHGENGLLAHSPEGWQSLLDRIAEAPEQLNHIAQEAYKTVFNKYNIVNLEPEAKTLLLKYIRLQ